MDDEPTLPPGRNAIGGSFLNWRRTWVVTRIRVRWHKWRHPGVLFLPGYRDDGFA
jgi:hypothetical protein